MKRTTAGQQREYEYNIYKLQCGRPKRYGNELIDAVEFNTELPRTDNGINIANNTRIISKEEMKRGRAVVFTKANEVIQGKIHRKPRPQDNSRIIIKHLVNELEEGEPTLVLQPCQGYHLSEETQTQKAKYNVSGVVKNCITSTDADELNILLITEGCQSSRQSAEKKRRACTKNFPDSLNKYLYENTINKRANNKMELRTSSENDILFNKNIIFAPYTTAQVINDIEIAIEDFNKFEIFTDRSLNKGRKKKATNNPNNSLQTGRMGVGVVLYYTALNQETYSKTIGTRVTGTPSSTRAELWAILLALKVLPFDATATIFSDSQASIQAIKNFKNKRKAIRWKKYKNPYIFQVIIQLIERKKLKVNFVKIKAYSGTLGNDIADKLAKGGATQYEELQINYNLLDRKINYKWDRTVIDLPMKQILKTHSAVHRQMEWACLNRTKDTDWKLSFQLIHGTNLTNLITSDEDHRNRKFGIKLLNNELLTKSLLNERCPDLYTNDTCISCNKCKEDSLHVFICNNFVNTLQKLFINRIIRAVIRIKGEAKQQTITRLITNCSFIKIDILRQAQNYNPNSRFSFIDIIRDLIPKQLKRLLRKVINNIEVKEITKEIFIKLHDTK
ncbi:hypothetical protein Glove_146g13 [Diversispora epigaea]|uniref:RNase H type-1 domain-containing protein n=1 Tax=Diversispora epigaea TaxID=1348612 RepID=A0A397IWJ1_9GLOM|nr:hypothetical protein Glove_146g13 [Diversispora epigaea]